MYQTLQHLCGRVGGGGGGGGVEEVERGEEKV